MTSVQPAEISGLETASKTCPGCHETKALKEFRFGVGLANQRDHCVACSDSLHEKCPGCQEPRLLSEFYYRLLTKFSHRDRRACCPQPLYIWERSKYCRMCYDADGKASRKKYVPSGWYLQTLEAQGGVCALCLRGPADKLVVDHRHPARKAKAKARGLLCNGCNLGLGHFQDSSAWLRRAADYLDHHNQDIQGTTEDDPILSLFDSPAFTDAVCYLLGLDVEHQPDAPARLRELVAQAVAVLQEVTGS